MQRCGSWQRAPVSRGTDDIDDERDRGPTQYEEHTDASTNLPSHPDVRARVAGLGCAGAGNAGKTAADTRAAVVRLARLRLQRRPGTYPGRCRHGDSGITGGEGRPAEVGHDHRGRSEEHTSEL